MAQPDVGIYVAHGLFWSAFGLALLVARVRDGASPAAMAASAPISEKQKTAPFSRLLIAGHALAFGLMYLGVGKAVFSNAVPDWFTGQRVVGALVIASGGMLNGWALVYFRSWRFRARLDEGHQLATEGPFSLIRNPIYMGLNLLALGTALWVPTVPVWAAFGLMILGSDLRGRAEEKLLERTFGDSYNSYRARTRRFVPGVY